MFFRKLVMNNWKKLLQLKWKSIINNKDFKSNDIRDISIGTTKENELFEYADLPSYYKINRKNYDDREKDGNKFVEISIFNQIYLL